MDHQRGPGWSSRGQKLSQKREEARSTVVTQRRRLKEGATDQGNLLVSCGNKILTVCKAKPSRGEAYGAHIFKVRVRSVKQIWQDRNS